VEIPVVSLVLLATHRMIFLGIFTFNRNTFKTVCHSSIFTPWETKISSF